MGSAGTVRADSRGISRDRGRVALWVRCGGMTRSQSRHTSCLPAQPVLPSFCLCLPSLSPDTGKDGVGTGHSSMTPTLRSPTTATSPTSNLTAEPPHSTGEQRREPPVSSCRRPGHAGGRSGRGQLRPRSRRPTARRPDWSSRGWPPCRGHAPRGRASARRCRRNRGRGSRPGGVPSPHPEAACRLGPRRRRPGQGRPKGRSEGPRSALDPDGERRGIRRLAATTAGPRTGAGSRPRRRRRGRSPPVSCPGEAGQRGASAVSGFGAAGLHGGRLHAV
jgi:hypothetical protein